MPGRYPDYKETAAEHAARVMRWSEATKGDAYCRSLCSSLEHYDVEQLAWALALIAAKEIPSLAESLKESVKAS